MSESSLPYGGSGLPYGGGKEPYTSRKKPKKAEGGLLMADDPMDEIIGLAAQIISVATAQQKPSPTTDVASEGSYADGGIVDSSVALVGPHTITAADLIGRAVSTANNLGAYTDTGGQKIAAPYVSGMANGYPVYSIPQSGDTAISDALNVARHVGRHKTGTPVYSLAGV